MQPRYEHNRNLKETEMKANFMDSAAKIIEEVLARTCIDKIDTEVIAEILKEELKAYSAELDGYYAELDGYFAELDGYYAELEEYYEEECYIAVSSARSKAYDDGHSDGYADGYDVGYDDGYSASL